MKREKKTPSEFASALRNMGKVKRIALSRLVVGNDAERPPTRDRLTRTARDRRWTLRPSIGAGQLLRALANARPPCVADDTGKDSVRVVFNGETVRILRAHVPEADWSSVRIPCVILDEELASRDVPSELIEEASHLLAVAMPEQKARVPKRLLRVALGVQVAEDDKDVVRSMSADQEAVRRSR